MHPLDSIINVTTFLIFSLSDTNDHKPTFERSTYNARIDENVARNTKLIQVRATDADSGPSGQIVYSITSQDRENHFYIDSNTGKLSFLIGHFTVAKRNG